jgi:HSP20 family molecular chaperone IbpA
MANEATELLIYATSFLSAQGNSIPRWREHKHARSQVYYLRISVSERIKALIEIIENDEGLNKESVIGVAKECTSLYSDLNRIIGIAFPKECKELESSDLTRESLSFILDPREDNSGKMAFILKEKDVLPPTTYVLFRIILSFLAYVEAIAKLGLTDSINREKIERSIAFEPEFKQAGISLLSYFSEIIDKKYPNMDVGISIEQIDKTVRLIIELPNGQRECIEHELQEYGLVLRGKKTPEEYTSNTLEAMMLKNKLEIAQLEAKQTREMLNIERKLYSSKIDTLEKQVDFLMGSFNDQQNEFRENARFVRGLSNNQSDKVINLINKIATSLEENLQHKEIEQDLIDLEQQEPSLIEKLNELIIKGSISGTAGNYLYAAIQAISKSG